MVDDMDWFVKFMDSVNTDKPREYEEPFYGPSLLMHNLNYKKHYYVLVKNVFYNPLKLDWYCEVEIYFRGFIENYIMKQCYTTEDLAKIDKMKSKIGSKISPDGFSINLNLLRAYEMEGHNTPLDNIIEIDYAEGVKKEDN